MASYSVTAGQIGAYEKTAVANTVDTITFADNVPQVEIISDGAASITVTIDGSTPTVLGGGGFYLPAVACVRVFPGLPSNGTVVKLISSGTPKYSVSKAVSR
jgi:hypothetical protein